jgi:hypothetical protein
MNYIWPYFKPIFDVWDHFTVDQRFKELTKYPGDWHTKWIANERYKVNDKFKAQLERFYEEPDLTNTLWDNKYRFTLLAFAERWIAVRQAQGFLKTRFQIANSDIGALNAIRNQGIIGSFRGNLLNLAHFVGVHYHALLYANNSPTKYIAYASLFELALYPLDTLRTLRYADVNGQFKNTFDCVTQVVAKNGLGHFYRGVDLKLVYNLFLGLNIWSYSTDSNLIYATFPLWVISYGLLSLKTRVQIAGSPLSYQNAAESHNLLNIIVKRESIRGLFKGVVPFLALNVAAAYCFPSILSEDKKKSILAEIKKEAPPVQERDYTYW